MSEAKRFVIGSGGTGGHIFPGIAIGRELLGQGCQLLFIGNRNSLESSLIAAEGFNFKGIRVQKLYRKLSLSNLLFPFILISATISSSKIMRAFKPQGVVCTGGFVSGPVALAAILLRIPLFFHESNSYPGLTTRMLARFTAVTYTSFAETAKHLRGVRVQKLGIPIPPRKEAGNFLTAQDCGLAEDRPILLVTGGSQGSRAINATVDAALSRILELGFQIIWQTGKNDYTLYESRHAQQKGVLLFPFSPKLRDYYRLARLALTRAGAMTLAELEANHLPAILVPLPSAAGNHQYYNALAQQKRGLALLLPQSKLNPDTLLESIENIQQHYPEYQKRLDLPPNHASADIAAHIISTLNKELSHAR